uniref:Uncharacterized protein n=1 Tax=Myotis myotis TaxID=51298 RepID=A0A7J8AMC5_MYOMY|nr:hypothetical protein mMyoMyo1_007907 [Myotis myotis]
MPPSVTLRVGTIGGLGHHPLSHSRQGPWGGCGTTPCDAQSRANQGVGALPPVTHRAGPIRGLGHHHSHTQGRADGEVMALPRHTQSRARGRAGGGGLGHHTLSHTEQGQSGGWGAAPCHTQSRREIRELGSSLHQAQSRADQGVGEPSPVTNRAGWIGRLWPRPVTHRAAGQSGGLGAAPITLIPVLGGILPFYYIG